jgi:cell wall-associated NlpC family hydrolase
VTRTSTHTIATRALVTVFVAAALFAVVATPAFADPIATAQAQAAKVQAQVEALNNKAEIASEEYNVASDRYDKASKDAAESARTLKKLTAQKNKLQASLDTRATSLYRQGPLGFLSTLLESRSFSDFDATYQMLTNVSRKNAQNVDDLKAAKAKATTVNARLVAQRSQAASQKRQMASQASNVRHQLAASQQVLAQANTQVKTLIAEQKAREAAAARAEAAALAAASRRRSSSSSSSDSSDNSSDNFGPAPAASSVGEKAVWYAEKKLGCSYVWAATGPNHFDCSGLTMWAYDKVGVNLPHYSREQINVGSRVKKSELAPGDLVFFGSPIHHVAMYVGNGKMIEAPYTGANVRISSLNRRSDYAGACRPYAN